LTPGKEIQIQGKETQIRRKEIQAGRNKFQVRRNEIQIQDPWISSSESSLINDLRRPCDPAPFLRFKSQIFVLSPRLKPPCRKPCVSLTNRTLRRAPDHPSRRLLQGAPQDESGGSCSSSFWVLHLLNQSKGWRLFMIAKMR
jgi:hypothetical protein